MAVSRMIASLKEDIEIIEAGLSGLKAQREKQELAPTGTRTQATQAAQSTIASMKVRAWRIASALVAQTPTETVRPFPTVHCQPDK